MDYIEVRNNKVVLYLAEKGIDFAVMDMTGKTIWKYGNTETIRKTIQEFFTLIQT